MIWYQLNKTQVANELETDLEKGLSSVEAKRRQQVFGPNQLPDKKPESVLVVFLRQFKSPLIYILVVCSAIVYYLGETGDSFIILVVLLFNALIGAIQEGRNARTLQSLRKLSFAECEVVRDGEVLIVPERELVPGDLVLFQEGQKVTADARVVFSSNLNTDEAALTGETGGIAKKEIALLQAALPASAQENMVFKGTNVVAGNGKAVVVGTGLNTEIGKISKALLEPEVEIPLQRNIRKLSQVIIGLILVISAVLFALGIMAGREPKEMFAVVVSLAVSMIPEGLPLLLTLILVTGVWRMSKRNALVKKLQAVEALGHADILAVDKTGTITKNEMVIKKVFVGGKTYDVTGNGYEPQGKLLWGGKPAVPESSLMLAATVAGLTSRATVMYAESEGKYKVAGDPTEAAMAVFAEKFNFSKETLQESYREEAELPFNSKNKYHAVFYRHEDDIFCAVTGAPEVLIQYSGHMLYGNEHRKKTAAEVKVLEQAVEEFSHKGLRVVACGYRKQKKHEGFDNVDDLVFVGLLAIEDQVRPEAVRAIAAAGNAGVKTVMITGDHKVTAKAIGTEAGIFHEGDEIVTGPELELLDERQLALRLSKVSIFARVTPDDKMKIIKAYRHTGLIVAMTGDGVNDAPSLVAADLGVAMGKIGTEVTKEAADIVLLDDNLGSIVAAIEEGRAMYLNIQKALLFLFSTSLGELLTIALALFLHMPMPVLAVQILWLNLITDPLVGMALAMDSKEPGLLDRKFKRFPKYFISGQMLGQMAVMGGVMAAGTLWFFQFNHPLDYGKAVTISLTLLAVFQWYNGFNCRSLTRSIFSKDIFLKSYYMWLAVLVNLGLQLLAVYNPYLQRVLKTTPLSAGEWFVILLLGLTVIAAEEIRKLVYLFLGKRMRPTKPAPTKIPAIRPI